MRLAGDKYLAAYPDFSSVDGSAETTTLETASVDFVVAGQAFHWFRPPETRTEFARILKPQGWAVLVWHERDTESTPFLRAYEEFLRRFSNEYEQVSHKYVATYTALERFYAPSAMHLITQRNQQHPDFDGLRGRLLSSSYIPKSGELHNAMLRELPQLFSAHAVDDRVLLEYETRIYYAHPARPSRPSCAPTISADASATSGSSTIFRSTSSVANCWAWSAPAARVRVPCSAC
jgi:SAM-dependent methyltransferase